MLALVSVWMGFHIFALEPAVELRLRQEIQRARQNRPATSKSAVPMLTYFEEKLTQIEAAIKNSALPPSQKVAQDLQVLDAELVNEEKFQTDFYRDTNLMNSLKASLRTECCKLMSTSQPRQALRQMIGPRRQRANGGRSNDGPRRAQN